MLVFDRVVCCRAFVVCEDYGDKVLGAIRAYVQLIGTLTQWGKRTFNNTLLASCSELYNHGLLSVIY